MRRARVCAAAMVLCILAHGIPAEADDSHAGHAHTVPQLGPVIDASTMKRPLAPEGVADLEWKDLFRPPGRRGLEYTDRARSLDGKKVRVLGYMVHRDKPVPGTLLLTPYPMSLPEQEYGQADELPPTTVLVSVRDRAGEAVPYTPGPLLLTGTLRLGNREEPDGRLFAVRLELDPQPPTPDQGGTSR